MLCDRVPQLASALPAVMARGRHTNDANSNQARHCVRAGGDDALPICTLCADLPSDECDESSVAASSVSLPPYTAGCHLLHSRRVLECGSGYGMLGLLMGHFASEVVMTDYKEEVLELLERNCAHAAEEESTRTDADLCRAGPDGRPERQRRLRANMRIEQLLWGAEKDLPAIPAAATTTVASASPADPASAPDASLVYDVFVGADIIYDGSVVPVLFAMLARYLSMVSPGTIILSTHLTRWRVVDQEMDAALERHGLEAIRVPMHCFMPQPMQSKFTHGNMLVIWKREA